MRTSIAMLSACFFAAGLSQAEDTLIYKSVAADGSVVFTDQAAPDATVIKPTPLNIMDSAMPDPETITIVSPVNDLTLINPEGPLQVDIEISPTSTLPQGYRTEIRLNGQLVVSGRSTSLFIDVPKRGSHKLDAAVVNAQGIRLVTSDEIEFHVHEAMELSTNAE